MEEILASIRRIIADDKLGSDAPETTPPKEHAPVELAPVDLAPAEPVAPPHAEMPAHEEPEAAYELRDVGADQPLPEALPAVEPVTSEASAPPVDDMADVIDLADHPDVVATRLVTDFRAAAPQPFPLLEGAEPTPADPLASPFTDAAVASSFDALAKSVMLDNKPLIEQLTRDMLRPMLKTWLDDNLPVMVEKLVRAEIERVARGGR